MADRSLIEWTDTTWNVINGCTVVSPGCTNCYAMHLAGTRFRNHPTRQGLTTDSKAGPVWNGQVRLIEKVLTDPLRWSRPRRIFVCAHGDLFHEAVPDAWLDQIIAVMALAPQHVFQILTKRPERMRAYLADREARLRTMAAIEQILPLPPYHGHQKARVLAARDRVRQQWEAARARLAGCFLPNVWLGVSAEDQTRADERIPILLDTPAAVRWLSAEPLLGPFDLTAIKRFAPSVCGDKEHIDALRGTFWTDQVGLPNPDPRWAKPGVPFNDDYDTFAGLDWVVAGGESGPDARPMHPDWARQLRDQCAAAGVPFLFKQWGDWIEAEDVVGEPEETGHSVVDADSDLAEALFDRTRDALITADGRVFRNPARLPADTPCRLVSHVGKKAAGRRLDGQIHDRFPPTSGWS